MNFKIYVYLIKYRMPPKKKTTIVFSDEETSDIEDEEFKKGKDDAHKRERDFLEENKKFKDDALLDKYKKFAKKDKYYKKFFGKKSPTLEYIENRQKYYNDLKILEDKPEAEKREKEFLKEHKKDKQDELFLNYNKFASEDPYYKVIFNLKDDNTFGNPPTIEYIKKRKEYYERYELQDDQEARERNFLKALKDEKDSYIILKKFQEYVNTDEILQAKFKGKKLTVVYVKYLINKYFEEKEIKKDNKENKTLTNILKNLNYAEDFREKLIENLDINEEDYSEYVRKNLNDILETDLTNEDIHTMINQYILDETISYIYFDKYFDEYLKLFNKNPEKFKEEQYIKKFLEGLLILIKKYTNEIEIDRKYILENEIQKEIMLFSDQEHAPETRKILFDKLRDKLSVNFQLYYKLINTYLNQYIDVRKDEKDTFKNFDEISEMFLASKYLKNYYIRKAGEEQALREKKEREEKENAISQRRKKFKSYYNPVNKRFQNKNKISDVTSLTLLNIYQSEITENIIILAKEKLSSSLLSIASLPEYDINSRYINDIIDYSKSTSSNAYEFIKKIISITVYLSNEVNNIVQFNYKVDNTKSNIKGTNNIFINNVKKVFYLANILVDLNPSEKLPDIFYNQKIPINKRENILDGINAIIERYIQFFVENIIFVRDIYKPNYRLPVKQYNPGQIETIYVEKPFKFITFQDELENFEDDFVFYNEEYVDKEIFTYKDGKRQEFQVDKNTVYKFKNKDLWDQIQNNNLINPYSGRVFNPQFIKEFEQIYMGKLEEKQRQETERKLMEKEENLDKKLKEDKKYIIPDLLDLINAELEIIQSGYYDDKEIIEEEINVEEKENEKDIPLETEKQPNNPYISIIINNNGKSYFLVLSKNNDQPIKYIYNIHDNILEENKLETLITSKNNIREQMIKQRNLNPNNFYVLLYFKSNKVLPSFSNKNNDQELIIKSVVDFEDEIKNNSEDNIKEFIRDIVNYTLYSTQEDINNLKVIFNNKNKPLITFYSNVENKAVNLTKKYIAFMYEYKDTLNTSINKNFVIFAREGLYISAVYNIDNKDFIDKDEERGILKSNILEGRVDMKKQLEKFKDNLYASTYLHSDSLLICSDDLISKYLEEISTNKEIKGKGQIEKYINEVDSSLCVDISKFEVKFNKDDVPNFYYNGKDYIDNKDLNCLKKLNTRHNLDEGDNEGDNENDNESVDSSDSSRSNDSSDNESIDNSDNETVSSNNNNDTNIVKCGDCKKEISKDKSLKSIVINKNTNNPEEIYFCCFICFEKYDIWPSLKKKPKKDKKSKKTKKEDKDKKTKKDEKDEKNEKN